LSVNRTQRYDAAIIDAGQGEKPLAMDTEDGTIVERHHTLSCLTSAWTERSTFRP